MIHKTSTSRTVDRHGWHEGYIAHCRCGWVSETWPTRDAARAEGDKHLAAFGLTQANEEE